MLDNTTSANSDERLSEVHGIDQAMVDGPRGSLVIAARLRGQAASEKQRGIRAQLIIAAAALEQIARLKGEHWWWPEDD